MLKKLFGQKSKGELESSPQATVVNRDSAALLKEATVAEKEGRMDEAINLLRDAYAAMDRETNGQPFSVYRWEPYLRLPMYLQATGRVDEAWREFHSLKQRTAEQLSHDLMPMAHSAIEDKQRLFLQREGKAIDAVQLGIMSLLSWATGLHLQGRIDELAEFCSRAAVEGRVRPLLKKAKREDATSKVSDVVNNQLKLIPFWTLTSLRSDLQGALGFDLSTDEEA